MPERAKLKRAKLTRREFLQETGAAVGLFLLSPTLLPPTPPVAEQPPDGDPSEQEISDERFAEDVIDDFTRAGTKVADVTIESPTGVTIPHEQLWKKGWHGAFKQIADAKERTTADTHDAFREEIGRIRFIFNPDLINHTMVSFTPSNDSRIPKEAMVSFGPTSTEGWSVHLAANQAPRVMLDWNWNEKSPEDVVLKESIANATAYLIQHQTVQQSDDGEEMYRFPFYQEEYEELIRSIRTGRYRSVPPGKDKQIIAALIPSLLAYEENNNLSSLETRDLLLHLAFVLTNQTLYGNPSSNKRNYQQEIIPSILETIAYERVSGFTQEPRGVFHEAVVRSIARGHLPDPDKGGTLSQMKGGVMYTVVMADGSGKYWTDPDPDTEITGPAIDTLGIMRSGDNSFLYFPGLGLEFGGSKISPLVYIAPNCTATSVKASYIKSGVWGSIIVDQKSIPGGVPENRSKVQFSIESQTPFTETGEKSRVFTAVFNEELESYPPPHIQQWLSVRDGNEDDCQKVLPPRIQRASIADTIQHPQPLSAFGSL